MQQWYAKNYFPLVEFLYTIKFYVSSSKDPSLWPIIAARSNPLVIQYIHAVCILRNALYEMLVHYYEWIDRIFVHKMMILSINIKLKFFLTKPAACSILIFCWQYIYFFCIYIVQPFQSQWTWICLDITFKVNIVTSSNVVSI